MKPRLIVASLACLLMASGCVERTDAPLPVDPKLAAQAGHWLDGGSFGGHAKLTVESKDPWEQRFDAGTFVNISGLDTTAKEVWVTDLGISRIQVFDYDGHLLRTLGRGVPIAGTMMNDGDLYRTSMAAHHGTNDWEQNGGQRWIGQERDLFEAADILVQQGGYMICDWAKTGIYDSNKRPVGVLSVPFDPTAKITRLPNIGPGWPSYLAGANMRYVVSDPLRNAVYISATDRKQGAPTKELGDRPAMQNVLGALYEPGAESPIFVQLLERAGKASGEPGKFNDPSGVALAFDKAVVCDTGNQRLQVFETRPDDDFYWCKLLRVIEATTPAGLPRFVTPRDVDIAPDGHVFILDGTRHELVELSPSFDRLGVVAKGFGDPYAVDVSPDGNHIFVTDRGDNRVHHYVRSR